MKRRRVLRYVTEQREEANAARSKKDKSESGAGFFGSGKETTSDAKARTQVRN